MANCWSLEKPKHDDKSDLIKPNNTLKISDVKAAQRKRFCALSELLSTEADYIQDLAEIVDGYIKEIRNPKNDIPDDLKGEKERMVFGNIEAIYEWHRDLPTLNLKFKFEYCYFFLYCYLYSFFFKYLQRCIKTPSELGPVIKRCQAKFHMYIVYCQNKPVSECIVSENIIYFDQIKQKLKHRFSLNDLLIKPVQRITKYGLLLREIKKQTERAKLVEEVPSIEQAYNVMRVVCKDVNDMMEVVRLKNFGGKFTAQGKLLLHGPLLCIEEQKTISQKPRELQVFLFEQTVIFADIVGKRNQFTSPLYMYRSHLQVNKMQFEVLEKNKFLLKSTDTQPDIYQYVCNAATAEKNSEWLRTINNVLQYQLFMADALECPIKHQEELKVSGETAIL